MDVKYEGRGLGKGDGQGVSIFQPAASFSLIENMKIWFKIQVIIYSLVNNMSAINTFIHDI